MRRIDYYSSSAFIFSISNPLSTTAVAVNILGGHLNRHSMCSRSLVTHRVSVVSRRQEVVLADDDAAECIIHTWKSPRVSPGGRSGLFNTHLPGSTYLPVAGNYVNSIPKYSYVQQ